jgi:hypothetical protein
MTMHPSIRILLLAGISLQAVTGQAELPYINELKIIADLGQINGQALACQELKAAGRAKSLMITHAPKTARFGQTYEESTQQGYAAQTNGSVACPQSAAFAMQLESISLRLQTSLLSTPEAAKP